VGLDIFSTQSLSDPVFLFHVGRLVNGKIRRIGGMESIWVQQELSELVTLTPTPVELVEYLCHI
jgi:hypothetical protein